MNPCSGDCDGADQKMCHPVLTLEALLDFEKTPWQNLVDPIAPRSRSRHLGDRYQVMEYDDGPVQYVENRSRPQVLLCHDFKGNYLNDKFINGVQGKDQWVDYRFYNWAAIDIFCYFSHNFVTIPTLQWLNCAHKNGVKVIGTVIVEPGSVQLLRDILQSEEFMVRVVEALVRVAQVCKFEGWLLNIECALETSKIDLLHQFVRLLTERCHQEVPGSMVIWYDAITTNGKLSWQNELNAANDAYFMMCDGIFLNYDWKRQHLERTANYVREFCGDRRLDVFVGIDVFGRSQKAQMNTDTPLEQVLEFQFSVALFAPGWTYESIEADSRQSQLLPDDRNVQFLQTNDRFWNLLWRHLHVRGPDTLPFYSSFCLGSGKFYKRFGRTQSDQCWFNLGRQHFQPTIPYTPPLEYEQRDDPLSYWTHHFHDALDGGSCLKLRNDQHDMRLFACDFSSSDDLIVAYAFRRSNPRATDLALVLKAYSPMSNKHLRIVCSGPDLPTRASANEVRAMPLGTNQCLQLLQLGAYSLLPIHEPINGWEIRYYYLSSEQLRLGSRFVDIGIRLHKDAEATAADHVLLGAIHLQIGFPGYRASIPYRTVLGHSTPARRHTKRTPTSASTPETTSPIN